MACTDYNSYIEMWSNWAFRDAILCTYGDTFGSLLLPALLVVGAINFGYYAKQESVGMPLVVTLLTGGFFLSQSDPILIQMVRVVAVIIFGLMPVFVLRKAEGLT